MTPCPKCGREFRTPTGVRIHRTRWSLECRETDLEYLEARTVETPGPLDAPCLVWQGASVVSVPSGHEYGATTRDGIWSLAHRWAFETFFGPIPEEHEIDHLCCVTRCVRPSHLEAVTPSEHALRTWARKRERMTAEDLAREALPVPW